MKILIVNEFYYPYQRGGAEVSTQLLAEELVNLGHQVTVCCSFSENKIETHNGVKIYYMKVNPLYWGGNSPAPGILKKALWHIVDLCNPFVVKPFLKILEEEKPDILHTSNLSHFSTLIWYLSRLKKLPVCHTIRDYYLLCHKCTMFKNGHNCIKRCFSCTATSFTKRYFSKYVNGVVGISQFVLDRHTSFNFFPKATNNTIIFNPVKLVSTNTEHKVNHTIGFIGTIHPSKGIEILIKAFAKCNLENYRLLVAGSGDNAYIEALKKLAGNSKVVFLGRQNASEFYKKIDLLVVPSLWNEPFGRTVVEAQSAGIPVIASCKGGIPEILADGKFGMCFNPDIEGELTTCIKNFVNKKIQLEKNFCAEKYSSIEIAKKYILFYESIKKEA
jgi:glycosyltransferase involved in cell wall biosynthesis